MPQTHSPDTTFTLQSLDRATVTYEKSPFTEHRLKAGHFRYSGHQQYPADWIVISMLACLVIIAWLQFFYNKRLKQVYRAPLSQRFLSIMIKEGSLFKERISVGLGLIYLFNFSLLLSLVLRQTMPDTISHFSEAFIFGLCSFGLTVYWLLKVSVMRFLGNVFRTMPTTFVYIHNTLAFSYITGLILFPLLILTVFLQSQFLLYTTLSITAILYCFRVMRGFFIGISLKKFSYLFLFVYLCTLEILPLLVILKGLYIYSKGF